MESHEDKEARRTAAEIFHIGHDIVGARVANLEFPLPQSVADIKRARRIGYVDIETMPFANIPCSRPACTGRL